MKDYIAFSVGQKELSDVIGDYEEEMTPIAFHYLINHVKTEEEVRSLFLGPTFETWKVLSSTSQYHLSQRIRLWRRYKHSKQYEVIDKISNLCSLGTLQDLLTALLPVHEMDLTAERRLNILNIGIGAKAVIFWNLRTYRLNACTS